jgi:uncharacterized protein (TIGR04255 family)
MACRPGATLADGVNWRLKRSQWALMSETVYSKAPIAQAILEVRLADEIPLKELKKLASGLDLDFQIADFGETKAAVSSQGTRSESRLLGHELTNDRGNITLRFLTSSFVFIQHSPYQDWWYFRTESERFWKMYRAVNPNQVLRLGLRYVNVLSLPFGEEVERYLRCYPLLPQSWPKVLTAYAMRLYLDLPGDDHLSAIVTQDTKPPATPEDVAASFILDIDVIRKESLPSEDAALWQVLDVMRDAKNSLFEGAITDLVREMIA